MACRRLLGFVLCLLLALGLAAPAFAADPPMDAKRDLQGISPKRHRYLFTVLGGAAIGAGVGAVAGGGGNVFKGILVGGGGASSAWLHSHPHDRSSWRSFAFMASHTALGTGLGWTICGCDTGALFGGLAGFGIDVLWQANTTQKPPHSAKTTP